MSEALAYAYDRTRDSLRHLGANRVYIDRPADRRSHRADLLRDVRPGDVVRVLFFSDLGGAQWRLWRDRLEAAGATVEEHRPTPGKPGRPRKWATTPDQDAQLRAAWLAVGPSLDARLAMCGAVLGVTLTRVDRHRLYARYGSPDNPKPIKEQI